MLYTAGNTEQYESLFVRGVPFKKAKGGSVWATCLSVCRYLYDTGQEHTYSVYAVDADWDEDTRSVGAKYRYRALKYPRPVLRVEYDIQIEAEQAITAIDALKQFMMISPWITKVTYDIEDKPVKTRYCRFCHHTYPGHFRIEDGAGPPCPTIAGEKAIYVQKRFDPEKEETRTDTAEMVHSAS